MKKTGLLIAAGLILGLGISAVTGLRAKQTVIETQALSDGYWLCGSFTNPGGDWDHSKSLPMTLESENVYSYDGLYLDRHDDYTFQVFKSEGGVESWDYECTATPDCSDGLFNYWWQSNPNAGVKFEEGIRIVKISINISTKSYSFSWSAPYVTIGATTERMPWDSTENKYVKTINGASSGDAISIETANGTKLDNFEANSGNNVYDDLGTKKVIASGDLTVYFNRLTSETWVGGYSENLNNFVSGFLNDTISEGICANPSEIAKDETNVWNYYKNWHKDFNAFEKAAFQSAVTSVGNGTTWNGKLEEAASRYVHLKEKYSTLVAFDEVVIAPSKIVLEPVASDTNMAGITSIALVTASILIAGGYFILRKKKED